MPILKVDGLANAPLIRGSGMHMSSNKPVHPNTAFEYHDYQNLPCHDIVWPAVLRQMDQRLPQHASVLDVGCGEGALCRRLSGDYHVCGLDISESGIALARKKAPAIRFEVASAYDSLFDLFGTSFDAAVCIEVIEHLYSPALFLRRVREVLKPDGLLLLSTPYHGYLKNLAIALAGGFDRHVHSLFEGGHIKFWSRLTIAKLLEQAGFKILHYQGVGRVRYFWKSMVLVARKARP